MRKVYEFKNKQSAVLHISFFGIDLKVDFENGNTARGIGAQLETADRFTQDAIENDSRFGSSIILREQYPEPGDEVKPEQKETKAKNGKGKAGKTTGSEPEQVTDCYDVNDVINYFQQKGENPQGDDDIKALEAKYNVTFPNVK